MKRGFLKNKSLGAIGSSKSSAFSSSSAAPTSGAPPKTGSGSQSSSKQGSTSRVPAPPTLMQDTQDKFANKAKIELLSRDANGAYTQLQPSGIDLNSLDPGTAAELAKLVGMDPAMLTAGAEDAINVDTVRFITVPAQRPFIAAVSPRVAEQIESSRRLCAQYQPLHPPRYRVGDSPVHGKGLFATEAIGGGEPVLREPPMAVVSQMMMGGSVDRGTMLNAGEKFAEMLYQALPEEDKKEFMSFANCKPRTTHGVKRGIIDTNTSALSQGGIFKGPYGAVTRDISRLNHSCESNAYTDWDVDTMTFALYAERPIRKGEEIFIAYVNPFQPKQQRQYALWGMYTFRCQCTKCSRE
ncbi:hypothetical protein EV715DRAFT_190878 [Schizophyllum commune]